ncbi:MAG: hypothetical protein WCR27_02095 [Eubacteriales bacterium]
MDKKIVGNEKDNTDIKQDNHQEEGIDMPALAKKEDHAYKGLSLSEKKLKEITISPKIKNGKVQLDKNDPAHRYIYED